ncbi:MAG: hypothetical protein AAF081_05615 [Actinomycetota bacterium]
MAVIVTMIIAMGTVLAGGGSEVSIEVAPDAAERAAEPTATTTTSTTTTTTTTTPTIPVAGGSVQIETETDGAGTVTLLAGGEDHRYGDSVVFVAEPDDGQVFERWDTEPAIFAGWWDATLAHRVPIATTATAGSATASVDIDFGALLAAAGTSGTFAPDSIRVVEVDPDGVVIDGLVVHQFLATDGASGRLFVDLTDGPLGARSFHVYFDTLEASIAPRAFEPIVAAVEGVERNGITTIEISAGETSWYFDGAGGGFVSMVDVDGDDWISWNTTPGSAGTFRGIPNAVFPEGYLHPGSAGHRTTIVENGPLLVVLETVRTDGSWATTWTIDAAGASMVMDTADAGYWFLYEGTPGGSLGSEDVVIRNDGQRTTADVPWTEDLSGTEWVAVADATSGRSILLVNHQDDTAIDSYGPLDEVMTVLGFGRTGVVPALEDVPATYSVRFVDSGETSDLNAQADAATTETVAELGSLATRTEGALTEETLRVALTGDLSVSAVFTAAVDS